MITKPNSNWWFVLPTLVLLLIMIIYPMIFAIKVSFQSYHLISPTRPFIGFQNYIDVLSDPKLFVALKNTLVFLGASVSLEFLIGFGLAVLMNRKFWGKEVIRTLIILPMVLTPVAVGLLFRFMYHPSYGLINYLLAQIGFNISVAVGEPGTAMPAVIVTDIWQWTPFVFLLTLAGLEALPREPFEAARVDGASSWQTFTHLTLPLLKPIIILVLIFRTMDAFKEFDKIFVLTAGGPGMVTEVISIFIYRCAFKILEIGRASAIAFLVLIVIGVIIQFYIKMMRRGGLIKE